MYVPRYLETTIQRLSDTFKVLYVGGPRQVGKTTLLAHCAEGTGMKTVSLDRLNMRELAQRDPELFLDTYPSPLFIDEAQYAPELFPSIKVRVDRSDACGRYWLSGSQQFSMMEHVQESLAGRVGIAHLLGFSWAEERHLPFTATPFLPANTNAEIPAVSPVTVFERILRGSFPRLVADSRIEAADFFDSYIQTYIERDIRRLFGVQKLMEFTHFIRLCAARTGQMLNVSDLARDADVSVHAAKEWLDILESTMQILLLRPFHANISKRLVKAPKLYFLDTGLAAHLTHWTSAETLMDGAMAGAFFETFVVSNIAKSYLFRGSRPPLWYFRNRTGHEVDLLIEQGRMLYPIDIKKASAVQPDDGNNMRLLRSAMPNIADGAIICLANEAGALDKHTRILPASAIT